MKTEYIQSELIDAYLNGGLQGSQLMEFESKLSSDLKFASQVNNQRAFNKAFQDQELANFHGKLDQFNPYKTPKGVLFPWGNIVVGITLLSGIIVGVLFLYNNAERPNIAEDTSIQKGPETDQQSRSSLKPSVLEVDNSVSFQKEFNSKADGAKTSGEQTDEGVSMYDFIDSGVSNEKTGNIIESEIITSEESSYIIVEKDIDQEDVMVISSDYKKKMHLVEDERCSDLNFNTKLEVISDCITKKGTINLVSPKMIGGKAPFEYAVNENDFQAGLNFENLPIGEYHIKIKDAEGCIINYHSKVVIKDLECK